MGPCQDEQGSTPETHAAETGETPPREKGAPTQGTVGTVPRTGRAPAQGLAFQVPYAVLLYNVRHHKLSEVALRLLPVGGIWYWYIMGLAELLLRDLEQYYSIPRQDPAHNWSEYIDYYICINRFEPIIKELFKWICQSVTSQSVLFHANRHPGRKNVSRRSVAETACCIPVSRFVLETPHRGTGTDISTTALR